MRWGGANVQIIRLPQRLDTLDLEGLNRRLRAEEIRLDWSDVEPGVPAAHLHRLLRGLNLADHIDVIGGDTVPEPLLPEIQAAFDAIGGDREADHQHMSGSDESNEQAGIALWQSQADVAFSKGQDDVVEYTVTEKLPVPSSGKTKSSTAQPMLDIPSAAQMRDELEAMVLRDLLGPAGGEEEEVDEERVRDRYLIGMLAPNKTQTMPEEMDDLAVPEEEGAEEDNRDPDASQKPSFSPASMGISFCVDRETTELLVTVRWGHYSRASSQTLKNASGNPRQIWKRRQRSSQRLIQLKEGLLPYWRPAEEEQPDIFVRGIVRRADDTWLVSLFLVNGQQEPKRLRDSAWIFQPEMSVEAPGGSPIFKQRISERQNRMTDEEKAMAMRYRHHIGFAVGHGISVHAETLADDPTCAVRLSTRVAPVYDVPMTEASTSKEIPALSDLVLDMRDLALAEPATFPAKLQPLITAYRSWIDEQEARISDSSSDLTNYRKEATAAIQHCRKTLERVQKGIDSLASNDQAAQAFIFMNKAMWLQRIHTIQADERRRGNKIDLEQIDKLPHNHSWRPFQLAFILLNIPALTDLHHQDRGEDTDAIADLLWFPTGGGKTEAYLGLTAYTLGVRRLQGIIAGRTGEEGVAVIMRYTLRLLTLQQFQRASALICACEMIRRADSHTWGSTPFRLGLWVGQRSTPNTTEDSNEANKQAHGMRSSLFGGTGSPRQLTSCPWCGAAIEGGQHIEVETYSRGRGRTLIYCGDPYGQCPFSKKQAYGEGLPVLVVDEEIYRLLPALLIATVDKFAQLPWKGETQMLFGQVEKRCSRHGFRSADLNDSDSHKELGKFPAARSSYHMPLRPPDLIVQDELHLISGPLGSLVGLYETVIDHLATWEVDGKKVRPKVIAATATIRRANQQITNLFMRDVSIFPPQGLDAEDNFFSRQREPSEQKPGRRYFGICANGRRLKAALIRVYVAYLSAAQVLFNKYGAAADPWMTLVGYFNSMSELGGMRRLVDDDVRSRLRKMEERGLARRNKPIVEELTSRKSSTAIPEVLGRLEHTFDGEHPWPIDVLLATNMISVGVDVRRLGLMVVTGQPKTTAEYIQATSRIGRAYPGLVCTVYNWSRPRDLSHYEQFEHYHATFYQQVEALSVTPFAPRALDRGLAALLTSYIRLTGTEFSKNEAAGHAGDASALFEDAINSIIQRAEGTNNSDAVEHVRQDLLRLQQYWQKQANKVPVLGYRDRRDSKTIALLKNPEQGKWEPFTCLNSLRDVEPSINLVIDERGLGDIQNQYDIEVGEEA
jgi:hypothetical protein